MKYRKGYYMLAADFLKLLFPDLKPTGEQFKAFCVKPAVELRQRARDEFHKFDTEYAKVEISYR